MGGFSICGTFGTSWVLKVVETLVPSFSVSEHYSTLFVTNAVDGDKRVYGSVSRLKRGGTLFIAADGRGCDELADWVSDRRADLKVHLYGRGEKGRYGFFRDGLWSKRWRINALQCRFLLPSRGPAYIDALMAGAILSSLADPSLSLEQAVNSLNREFDFGPRPVAEGIYFDRASHPYQMEVVLEDMKARLKRGYLIAVVEAGGIKPELYDEYERVLSKVSRAVVVNNPGLEKVLSQRVFFRMRGKLESVTGARSLEEAVKIARSQLNEGDLCITMADISEGVPS